MCLHEYFTLLLIETMALIFNGLNLRDKRQIKVDLATRIQLADEPTLLLATCLDRQLTSTLAIVQSRNPKPHFSVQKS